MARETGLDRAEALAFLADQCLASKVRQIENVWVQQGIRSVSAVVLDRKHLVIGAQEVENYTSILELLAKESGRGGVRPDAIDRTKEQSDRLNWTPKIRHQRIA